MSAATPSAGIDARPAPRANEGSQTLRVDLPPRRDPLPALLIAASRDVPQQLTRLPLGAPFDLRRPADEVDVRRVLILPLSGLTKHRLTARRCKESA